MIIEQMELEDFNIRISFQTDSSHSYEATFTRNGQTDKQSFSNYEAARRWLAETLNLPVLLIGIDNDASSEKMQQFYAYTKAVKSNFFKVHLIADDNHIFTVQANGRIRHFDRLKGIEESEQNIEEIDSWAIAENGQKAVFIRGRTIEIWDIFSMQRQHTISIPFAPLQATILTNGNILTLANSYSWFFPINEDFPFIQLYDLETGQLISQIRVGAPLRDCTLRQVVFSHQKDWVSFGIRYDEMAFERTRQFILPIDSKPSDQKGNSSLSIINKIKLGLKNRLNFLRIFSKQKQVFRYQGYINDCAEFSQNGRYLFLGINYTNHQIMKSNGPATNRIHVWKQNNNRFAEERWLSGHEAEIRWLFVSSDDRNLISVSVDGNIRIWEAASGTEQHSSMIDMQAATKAVLDKKGSQIAIGDKNGKVIIWHVHQRKITHSLDKHDGRICHLSFTSSGDALISASVTGEVLEWPLNSPINEPKIIFSGDIIVPEQPDFLKK